MFEHFPKSEVSIVAKGGAVRGTTQAIITDNIALIENVKLALDVGDEIRRLLPSGQEEVFSVVDPAFQEGLGSINPHYQAKLERKGAFPKHTGGNYSVSISGPNARINIGSLDSSTNTVNVGNTFDELRAVVQEIGSQNERDRLLELIARMEDTKGKPSFAEAYQKFITGVGQHISLVAPFIPLLSKFISP